MANPVISIFTSCFNAEKHVRGTLRSILNQSFKEFEVIIQDGASTDNTLEIIKYEFSDPRIKVFSQPDTGGAEGFSRALNKTSGSFLMCMPFSDKYEDLDWFQKCVDILNNNPFISLVHGNDIKNYKDSTYGSLRFPEFENKQMPSGRDFLPYWLATKYHISELNFCVRREVFFRCYKQYKEINIEDSLIDGRLPYDVLSYYNPFLTFTYFFVREGYLPCHIPTTATSTLQHEDRSSNQINQKITEAQKKTHLDKINRLKSELYWGEFTFVYKNGDDTISKNNNFNRAKLFLQIWKHRFFRKNFDFDIVDHFNIYVIKDIINPFFHPKRFIMKLSMFKYIRFIKHYFLFWKSNDERFNLTFRDAKPIINEWGQTHQFDRHYVYHTSWAARKLFKATPQKHIDISSDIRFASLIAVFTNTEFYDFRKIKIDLPGLSSHIADLIKLPFESNNIESISCMHVVEQCGLGRYGDIINPKADLMAMKELIRVLAPGGKLFFVAPIAGKPRIEFNAHRIYSHNQILSYFSELDIEEFTLIPDNPKDGHLIKSPPEYLIEKQKYACGCYLFTKLP